MIQSVAVFLGLTIVAVAVGLANLYYQDIALDKFFYTAIAIAVLYFVFRIVLEMVVARRIRDAKVRYSFRKAGSILFLVLSFVVVLRIWIVNPQALLVAYGLTAAGVAIALQELIKNFAGGIVILVTGLYRVGNRVNINGKSGDVIDIGLFYTTILEMGEWVGGDQATGRLSMLPNGAVLSNVVNNYTKDHHYLWDEVSFPIPYECPWREAATLMRDIAAAETHDFMKEAKKSLSQMEERYFLSGRTLEPDVFVEATDNWINLTLRYVVEVRERRAVRNTLTKAILLSIEGHPSLRVASSTVSIQNIPRITLRKES